MKTIITSHGGPLCRALCTVLLGMAALWATPRNASAQLYVTYGGNTIGEYNTATGATINPSLVTGLSTPVGLALSGNDLFVSNYITTSGTEIIGEYNATTGSPINAALITEAPLQAPTYIAVIGNSLLVSNQGSGQVSEYDASTGAVINANFITGVPGVFEPEGLAVSGNDLFVANYAGGGNGRLGTVGEYNGGTGASISANFITGLSGPEGLAVSGNDLFVVNTLTDTVGEYNATTGAAINANFITGLSNPEGIAVLGNTLYVANSGNNTVGKYDATTGAAINASFITGVGGPFGLAVASVPEPSPWSMIAVGGVALLGMMLRRKRRTA